MYNYDSIRTVIEIFFKSVENFRKNVGTCKKENDMKTIIVQSLNDLLEGK